MTRTGAGVERPPGGGVAIARERSPRSTSDLTAANPLLEGNFAPVREELTVTELPCTGTIPEHLDGRYLRIGPNPVVDPDPATYEYWFGAGMVHGLRVRDGHALWYRNRSVRSADVARALGEKWHKGPHRAGFDFSANTNVIGHAGRTFALSEGCRPYELSRELDTLGPSDFGGSLRGGYTAHPHRDPVTGELHAVSYSPLWGNRVRYSVTGADGRVRRTTTIEVTGRPMIHDFSLTERHVVIYDLPVTLEFSNLGRFGFILARVAGRRAVPQPIEFQIMRLSSRGRVSGGDMSMPYHWNPDYPARVGVMAREGDGTDIRWFDVEPCFVFHPVNAYDDGDRVVLDVVRHPKMFAPGATPYETAATLDRWTVDLALGVVKEERLDDRSQEFPRVDERKVARRHRYAYAVGATSAHGQWALSPDALLKHDLLTQKTTVAPFGPAKVPSEFVFVPHSPDAPEDEGVLMGYVYDTLTDRSDLVFLDAATLEMVASVHLPARVPQGFHGNWLPTLEQSA